MRYEVLDLESELVLEEEEEGGVVLLWRMRMGLMNKSLCYMYLSRGWNTPSIILCVHSILSTVIPSRLHCCRRGHSLHRGRFYKLENQNKHTADGHRANWWTRITLHIHERPYSENLVNIGPTPLTITHLNIFTGKYVISCLRHNMT